ncbi:aminopeptidase [Arundinibacter roseus]|uniref:Aminopeptidase n=1 Tax=Arundinibacter roseus TaxID=2070510 RepID=A0A4R4KEK8_9BACT|nr:aminopeptidase [Arundinibacter roseus]TDB65216.1 aminopeptidase [Arundinibacter roseus]
MIKKTIAVLLLVLFLVGLFYRNLVSYAWMQASGQVKILMNVTDVEDVLHDASFPDSLKQKIRLIEEIKQFGVDSLGLNPSKNYTTFYNQHGKPILWVLTASEKYQLQAREWKFPIIGTFSYKGFFDSTRAVQEEKALMAEGLDTEISEVSAWSTLGYLKDPILSSMLARSEGSLANLILHELTHGTLFVKDNLELNENLASFVGDWGAIRFLTQKYGAESVQLKKYEFSKKYNDAYAQHVLRGARQLDSLYKRLPGVDSLSKKDSLKYRLIQQIVTSADTLLGGTLTLNKKKPSEETKLPNNAYFIAYKTYKSRQNIFRDEFENKFNRDFRKYLLYLKEKYPSL